MENSKLKKILLPLTALIVTTVGLVFFQTNGQPLQAIAGSDRAWCDGAVPWNQVSPKQGELLTVKGPAIAFTQRLNANGSPTFINIGADYPDKSRLTAVIWGNNLDKFAKNIGKGITGKEVCIIGKLSSYKGVNQIELNEPHQLKVR